MHLSARMCMYVIALLQSGQGLCCTAACGELYFINTPWGWVCVCVCHYDNCISACGISLLSLFCFSCLFFSSLLFMPAHFRAVLFPLYQILIHLVAVLFLQIFITPPFFPHYLPFPPLLAAVPYPPSPLPQLSNPHHPNGPPVRTQNDEWVVHPCSFFFFFGLNDDQLVWSAKAHWLTH